MADQSYDLGDQNGAPMDYPEHEATYSMFMSLVKWGIIFNVALLIAMAAGFFMGAGFVGGTLIFILLMIASKVLA
ncbi:aa3-type cytochrome c oxidase subunit IV [Pseudahrensia aquimaris]|uniref:Aa3-type cytochrome c oxidase subunit IV n=2 Tax=Pseudahrensia aquimaris TaxID=744461 RepID=A0ABW3F9K7_9HYPH